MENTVKKDKTTKILIALISVMIVGIGVLIWMVVDLNAKNKNLTTQTITISADKELVKQELNNLLADYEDLSTNNDSLNSELEKEKAHIKTLIREIENMKSVSIAQMEKYKEELNTLRSIMKHYVYQIDSLNTLNQDLMAENENIRMDNERLNYEYEEIVERNDELEVVVEKASMLKANGINVIYYNSRGKETTKASKIVKLKTVFTLVENSLAKQGNTTIYLRIIRPDGFVMTSAGKTLDIHGESIAYSTSRQVLYEGSNLEVAIYFDVPSTLTSGKYSAELFVENYLIGGTNFLIE
ncbi:MAG: hypothetical protein KBB11_04105 [Bacteroidales bacterium]|nr:hypothetical protein [Bacteroidales bacterium]HOY38478.1 hypothetical protein [Bacteroidales bacterium]HQP05016.1 hypothetical protein [Bacteroidales bacterium]